MITKTLTTKNVKRLISAYVSMEEKSSKAIIFGSVYASWIDAGWMIGDIRITQTYTGFYVGNAWAHQGSLGTTVAILEYTKK